MKASGSIRRNRKNSSSFAFQIVLLIFILSVSSAQAGDCIKLEISPTEYCKDLQISANLSACGEEVIGAPEIRCKKKKSEVIVHGNKSEYVVKLRKNRGAWETAWEVEDVRKVKLSQMHLKFTSKLSSRQISSSSSPATRAPAAIRPNETTSQSTFSILTNQQIKDTPIDQSATKDKEFPVKVTGFIDSQYQANSNVGLARGFLLNDGALYFSSELPGLDFKLDLPFRMYSQGNSNFEFGFIRAQAYLGQKYSNGFRWKIGQFDTTYGFEGNDTVDITFTREGSVYNFTDPFVHTGLLLGYDFDSELGLNLYIANPNDRGVLLGKSLHYGLQLVKFSPSFRFAPGFMFNQDFTTQAFNYYLDLVTGVTFGKVSIDGEVSYNYRTDIIDPVSGSANRGLGLLLQILYNFSELGSFGARGEYITNQALTDSKGSSTQSILKSQVLVFVGPQYYIAKGIRLKLDYSLQIDQDYSSNVATYHGLQLAGVLKF